MAAGSHFGWPKITFDRISRHFRSICNFYFFWFFFTKWLPAAILDDRKSLLIVFLAISYQYATFFSQNSCRRPFWMTENHFRSHFSPFQINTQLWFLFTKWLPAAILDDRKSLLIALESTRHFRSKRNFSFFDFFFKMAAGGHFRWPKITFDRITRHFRSICNFVFKYFFKMAAGGHFGCPICAKNNRVLPLCVINGYAKYEVDRWICDTVRDATSFLSIFIQNGRQRPFCFSDWCKKSYGSCNLGPQWLWRIWIWLVYLWQSYGLYKHWRAASVTAAETAAAEPKT